MNSKSVMEERKINDTEKKRKDGEEEEAHHLRMHIKQKMPAGVPT